MRSVFLEKLWLSFPWKVSIQRKLLVAILAVVVVFGTVHIALIYSIITDEVEEQFVIHSVRLAYHLAGEIEESLLYDDIIGVENALWQWVSTVQEHKYALVISPTGRVKASTFKNGVPVGLADVELPPSGHYSVKTIYDRETPNIDIGVPIMGGAAGWLRLGLSQRSMPSPVRSVLLTMAGMVLAFALIGAVGAVILSKMITYPLEYLVKRTHSVDLAGQPVQIEVRTGDELEELAKTFERMVNRLRESHSQLSKINRRAFEAEKMASLGLLSSGVAHEIRNPLMGIEKGLKRISHDPDTVEQIRKYVPLMLNGVEHINSVISGLLAFARRDAVVATDVDLDRLIDHALVLVHHRLEDSDIIVQRETETEKGKLVRADPQCLSQVLVNLVLNAIDAMPDGGKLSIHSLSEDGFVWVEVQDTGTGIPATDLTRIWDPFFTTKPPGKGTGLGLAVVRSLVEAEGGEIQIESRTGQGSLFRFSVPVAEGQV